MPHGGTKKQKTKKTKRRQRFAWLYAASIFPGVSGGQHSVEIIVRGLVRLNGSGVKNKGYIKMMY